MNNPSDIDIKRIAIGLDIGSTTVKAVVCDCENLSILWSDYRRHETQQAETVVDFMIRIGGEFKHAEEIQIFCTGSGSGPLIKPLNGSFVQEVNAIALAVEKLHSDVNSVIELGGQDAKIIMFRSWGDGNDKEEKQVIVSMNDKCASGTGATIDKCILKVGITNQELCNLVFDPNRLHNVAAKCGVFAETDVVNLLKNGIPGDEIMNSLADAIVMQNLSVLTRGNTLFPKVLLLGGPNSYLPFLVQCWRNRIAESWQSRGFDFSSIGSLDELIFVPENSQYYAAYGAVVFGMEDVSNANIKKYRGIDSLKSYLTKHRMETMDVDAIRPLVKSRDEKELFIDEYKLIPFSGEKFKPGQEIDAVIGLDGGSTSSKAVLMDVKTKKIIYKSYKLSKGNPIQDAKDLMADIINYVSKQKVRLNCRGFGVTGYAANVLQEVTNADVNIVETVAHMLSTIEYFPNADVICDIGGQDIKVLVLSENDREQRDIKDFRLSNQCSAGNGMLLQAMAEQFGVKLEDYAEIAFSAKDAPKFSYGCGVFLDADRVNFQKEGYSKAQILAGLAQVLPKNIWQYVVQIPRLDKLGRVFILQGGTQLNLAAVKAQIDYIKERVSHAEVKIHPHCCEAGAVGAALETIRIVNRKGYSSFIGIASTINLSYSTRNDESTVCHFCQNNCSRTFIDAVSLTGKRSRYISGFSCEQGTVESKADLKDIVKQRSQLQKLYPNLVEKEAELAFKHIYTPQALPEEGTMHETINVLRLPLWMTLRRKYKRGFERSHADIKNIKIGMPRVLNMYAMGPFFRAYFETLGISKQNIIWSAFTSREMWNEGCRYGSIDPCFPSKVIQAHIHELLFHAHNDSKKRRGPLDYIYFPCITHIPTWLNNVVDTATCPIVAGSPNVIKAAFNKEIDFFDKSDIEYIDNSITFAEKNLLKRQLYETWRSRLGVTEDESDFAVEQGFQALDLFNKNMESWGRQVLEQVERDGRMAILMLGRPYHNDPGINHDIPLEFQSLGYPVLTIRSIPKDEKWLKRFIKDRNPLDISDVWPENYSTNSVEKVWGAYFAAHHPNVALLDLSSFKCGHDAPTYGIIEKIVSGSSTPYCALHDIDENKPAGSISIRVKTYAYKLKRVEEAIEDKISAQEKAI